MKETTRRGLNLSLFLAIAVSLGFPFISVSCGKIIVGDFSGYESIIGVDRLTGLHVYLGLPFLLLLLAYMFYARRGDVRARIGLVCSAVATFSILTLVLLYQLTEDLREQVNQWLKPGVSWNPEARITLNQGFWLVYIMLFLVIALNGRFPRKRRGRRRSR